MIEDVDLAGAAALVHRSAERFTKGWRRLRADEQFPSPFVGDAKGARPWWRVADIETWKAWKAAGAPAPGPAYGGAAAPVASGSPAQRRPPTLPANDPVARPPAPGDLAAQLLAAAGG